jgi:hypothetical protein
MASKRGKRSPASLAKRYILDTSFHDRNNAETISLADDSMVIAYLDKLYPDTPPPTVDVVRGEVLIDPRGDGSFQK